MGSAAFSPERDVPRSRRGNGRAAVPAFASICSKLQRLPNKQAINFGFHPPGADRRGKSRPLQTRGLARPLLIRAPTPVRAAGMDGESVLKLHRGLWGLHALLCVAFFVLLPWKFFGHIVYGVISWSTRSTRPLSQLRASPVDVSPGAVMWRDLTVTAFGIPHANMPTLAYRVEMPAGSVVFSSDQNGTNPEFV